MLSELDRQRYVREIKARVIEEAGADRFDMGYWFQAEGLGVTYRRFRECSERAVPCRTTACLAGWGVVVALERGYPLSLTASASDAVRLLLGLPTCEVFYVGEWPAHLQRAYCDAETGVERATIACDALDLFMCEEHGWEAEAIRLPHVRLFKEVALFKPLKATKVVLV